MDTDLTWHELRKIAVLAGCDPRTVRAYFRGTCYSTTAQRVEDALSRLGWSHLIIDAPDLHRIEVES